MTGITEVDLDEVIVHFSPSVITNENDYLELANDCKNRIAEKNEIISNMKRSFIMLYTFITRYMQTDEDPFLQEAKMIIDECLKNYINIE